LRRCAGASRIAAVILLTSIAPAGAETVLRVAMTAADIPLTTGQPDQGGEGVRFMGVTLYDGLVNWDLSHADRASVLVPGLATEWSVSKDDPRVWTFKLRPDVKLHDGSPWNADLAVWNFDKLLKQDAPQYDRTQVVQAADLIGNIASYRAVDPLTLEIVTKQPDSLFPYFLVRLFFGSKARFDELGADWNKVAAKPAGTGPWILGKFVPHERAELVRNPKYWDRRGCRRPTVWYCSRCPTRRRGSRPCCRAGWIGSRRHRPTRSTR
jgi:ABC-type transport system substrate-binding protein